MSVEAREAAGPFAAATPRKLAAWLVFVGLIIAVNYAGTYATSTKTDPNELYRTSTAVGSAAVYALFLGVVLLIARGAPSLLALARPASWPRALLLALGVLAASYLVIAIVLDPILHGGREQGVVPTHWQPSHAAAYIANWIVVAGVAPAVEELTYRGLGLSLLAARFGTRAGIVLVGLLFAASHGLLQAFPELALLGAALAWLRLRTGSVYPGMVVHAAFNSIALAYVFVHR